MVNLRKIQGVYPPQTMVNIILYTPSFFYKNQNNTLEIHIIFSSLPPRNMLTIYHCSERPGTIIDNGSTLSSVETIALPAVDPVTRPTTVKLRLSFSYQSGTYNTGWWNIYIFGRKYGFTG